VGAQVISEDLLPTTSNHVKLTLSFKDAVAIPTTIRSNTVLLYLQMGTIDGLLITALTLKAPLH
jgi:hypothetical protein